MARTCLRKTKIGVGHCCYINKAYAYFGMGRNEIMHIQYEKYSDILSEKEGFGTKIVEEIIDNIVEQVTLYCQERERYYKDIYGIEIEINYDVLRANQAIIDTLEDLKRLKEFHPVQYPNRLKCAAYLAYWWLQRQPLTFSVPEDKYKEFFDKATQEDVARVIHANAFWLVVYVFSELFTAKELPCAKENPQFQKQWNLELDYIFYYFCYRADSPKSIEAFLATTILHPVWEVKEGVLFEK